MAGMSLFSLDRDITGAGSTLWKRSSSKSACLSADFRMCMGDVLLFPTQESERTSGRSLAAGWGVKQWFTFFKIQRGILHQLLKYCTQGVINRLQFLTLSILIHTMLPYSHSNQYSHPLTTPTLTQTLPVTHNTYSPKLSQPLTTPTLTQTLPATHNTHTHPNPPNHMFHLENPTMTFESPCVYMYTMSRGNHFISAGICPLLKINHVIYVAPCS